MWCWLDAALSQMWSNSTLIWGGLRVGWGGVCAGAGLRWGGVRMLGPSVCSLLHVGDPCHALSLACRALVADEAHSVCACWGVRVSMIHMHARTCAVHQACGHACARMRACVRCIKPVGMHARMWAFTRMHARACAVRVCRPKGTHHMDTAPQSPRETPPRALGAPQTYVLACCLLLAPARSKSMSAFDKPHSLHSLDCFRAPHHNPVLPPHSCLSLAALPFTQAQQELEDALDRAEQAEELAASAQQQAASSGEAHPPWGRSLRSGAACWATQAMWWTSYGMHEPDKPYGPHKPRGARAT